MGKATRVVFIERAARIRLCGEWAISGKQDWRCGMHRKRT